MFLRVRPSLCRACLRQGLLKSRAFSSSSRRLTDEVRIVEVGPRDGLQNEKQTISLDTKLELIRRLAKTGIRYIEAGSFVAPKWVPQMANSAEVLNHILGHPPGANHHINYNFLVPNIKGLHNFLKVSEQANGPSLSRFVAPPTPPETPPLEDPPAGNTSTQDPNQMPTRVTELPVEPEPESGEKQDENFPASNTSSEDPNEMPSGNPAAQARSSSSSSSIPFSTEISIFAAATDSFSQANTNCTVAESLERFKPIIALAKENSIRVRGYVSVALGCPFDGPDVDPKKVADLTASLLSMGVDEVSVADTTGMGTAPKTERLLKALSAAGVQSQDLALHFHDTYGQALVNTVVGLEHGIRAFDSSVAGLGGCPYAKGATGNVATEDLVYALHSLGMSTGIEMRQLAETGEWISNEIGRANQARAGKAILARLAAQ